MSKKNKFKDFLSLIGIIILILFVLAAWIDTFSNCSGPQRGEDYDPSTHSKISRD